MRFYDVEGGRGTVYSRLLSLRGELWDQGDDGIIQMVGFKLGKSNNIYGREFQQKFHLVHLSMISFIIPLR